MSAMVVGGVVSERATVIHAMSPIGVKAGEPGPSACGRTVHRCHGWLGTFEWSAEKINARYGVKACPACAKYTPVVTFEKVTS
jgi:hypothetical protein